MAAHVPDTAPYPWPFDGADEPLDAARLAIVVCGAQPHWVAMAEPGSDEALERIFHLVDELRGRGALVAWIRTGATSARTRPIDRTLPLVGSAPWALLSDQHPSDLIVDTPGHDGFAVAWLDVELRARGLDRLALVGIGTESTVSGTNRSANDRGYECLTLTDAVVHHEKVTGEAALSSICMSGGIFGAIGTSDALLDALHSGDAHNINETTQTRRSET